MKKLFIIPFLFCFACQTEEANPTESIDIEGIYSALNADFHNIAKEVEDREITFNNSYAVANLTREYYDLNTLGNAELLFNTSNSRISNEEVILSEKVQEFMNNYTQSLTGKNLTEAMDIIELNLTQLENAELNDDNIVISLTLITSKIVLEAFRDNPELFSENSENGRVNSCAGDVAIGAGIGVVVGGILGGAIGTFIAPGAGTVAGAAAGAKWGSIVGATFGGAAGALIGGIAGGECVE